MDFIFDRCLQRHRRQRGLIDTQHKLHIFLHDLMHERLSYVRRQFKSVLVIGDFEYRLSGQTCSVIMIDRDLDALPEYLPFKESSFDLVISYMDLHHANDVPGILKQINYCLKPDGLFLGAFLGGNSLWQLRAAVQQAELVTRGGCSLRVAPMISVHDAAALLQRAGFAIPVLDHEIIHLTDSAPWGLLQQLRRLGLSNTLYEGFKGLSGKQFFRELAHYLSCESNIKLELDILLMSGWSPAPNQQKPLQRGSAQQMLSQFLK